MQAKFGLIKKKRQKLSRLIIHIDSFIIFVAPFYSLSRIKSNSDNW